MTRLRLNASALSEQAEKAGDTTSYAIALRAGVQPSTLSRLLNGTTTPTLATLVALKTAYRMDTIDSLVLVPEQASA
ncbi:helix-turn-helix domain-containing protein [Streptomyces cinereoruber]|uniref:helix-turn-helix domain-containing protein n=1 Tax=Streptomyces cinereoruber TaxID=67260 RepID=UPI0036357557